MISVPGIGSGLDVGSLVSQLVSAEREPVINSLGRRQSSFNSDVSGLGSLKSALSSFNTTLGSLKNLSSFETRTATSSDEDVFTAIATSNSVTGKYNIEVRNLATAHKLMSQGVADANTVVGEGTLTLTVDGVDINIDIDSDNNTLAGIRDAINTSAQSLDVTATIINVDDGSGGIESKLVLTSNNTGADNAITINVSDNDGNHTDSSGLSIFYFDTSDATTPEQLTEINAAEDSDVRIDGQTVTTSGNTVANAIDGVTLNLLAEDIGVIKELNIEIDNSAVNSAITNFVGGYNTFIAAVNELTSFNPDTGETGALFGDSTLRLSVNSIRNDITSQVSGLTGSVKSLVDIGITTTDTGLLTIDSGKLESAIANNLEGIGDLFATQTDGIANRLDNTIDSYIGTGGIIDNRTDGLQTRLDSLDDEFIQLERRLETLEIRLLNQFSALDGLLSQLQSSSEFLTRQFTIIEGITTGEN
jgi:flagellar hook-associated protein 2